MMDAGTEVASSDSLEPEQTTVPGLEPGARPAARNKRPLFSVKDRKRKGVPTTTGVPNPDAPRRGRPPKLAKVIDITDGLEVLIKTGGGYIAEATDPGVGRALMFTAPTSARIVSKAVARFPALHSFLSIFLGAGAGLQEAQSAFGIPLLVGRMERHPESIPATLPVIRAYMRPILRDMVSAAREEKKMREELARLESELGDSTGVKVSLDEIILVQLLGLDQALAAQIIDGSVGAAELSAMAAATRAVQSSPAGFDPPEQEAP